MSKALSPREVCSTTMGTSGLIVLDSFASSGGFLPECSSGVRSASGGPELPGRLFGRLVTRGPQLLSRLGLLDADRLGLAHQELDGLAGRDLLAEAVKAVGLAQPIEQLLGRGA